MSQLQLGLLGLALGVWLLFMLYTLFMQWRNKPRQAANSTLADENIELMKEPHLDDAPLEARAPVEKKSGLDPLIDTIAPIVFDAPIAGEVAIAALPHAWRVGSKPFAIEGRNAVSGQWEFPLAGQSYDAFQAGVQLANRTGALNDIEYSEFVVKTQAFADVMGGDPQFPEMLEEVARARELDQFASQHDVQLAFKVRAAGTAWSPGYVQQNAQSLGFVAETIAGRMLLLTSSGPLLSLHFDPHAAAAQDPSQTAVHEITLTLDVPHASIAEQAFDRLCDLALQLAQNMDGKVTDEQGHPLDRAAMALIHADLQQLYQRLSQHELEAGSHLARRLFS